MSSSPSRQELRAPAAGNPSSGKRRAPPEGSVHSHEKENTEPRNHNDMMPDNPDTRQQSSKSSSPRSKLPPAEASISGKRGPSANRQARPQQNTVKPQYVDDTLPDDRNPRSQPRNSSPQTSRPAPAGRSSAQKRRPPTGRTAQPHQQGDSNNKNPRMHPNYIPDSGELNYVPERYGNDNDYVSNQYYDELDGNQSLQPRGTNPSRRRAAPAMRSRARGNQQDLNLSAPRTDRCDGSCEWYLEAKAGLEQKERELEDARDEIRTLSGSADSKKSSLQTKSVAADQKRLDKKEAAQIRERRRQDKMDADRRMRQDKLDDKRKQKEHERDMDQKKTPEERAAEGALKHQKLVMATNLASTAGNLLVEAHKANSQVQTTRMHQEMQGQTAARRQAQREGATGSGRNPARTRRPDGKAARPGRPQGEGQELEGM